MYSILIVSRLFVSAGEKIGGTQIVRRKFNYANGILSLLILTGVINSLFIYYNIIEAERNKRKISEQEILEKTIQKQDEIYAELKKLRKEREELLRKLKDRTAKLFTLISIDDEQDAVILQQKIEKSIEVLKDTPEYAEYLDVLNACDAKELEYVLKYIDYYLFLDLSRKNLFSENYMNGIDRLAEKGFFLYLMSTPDIPEKILCDDKSGEIVGQFYALKLRTIFSDVLNSEGEYPMCIENAIGFYEDGNYLACSQELMRILPNFIKELEDSINVYRMNGELKRFSYYSSVADKILNYYRKIETPLEKWDGISLNYYDLQRDTQSYEVTDLDCIRLFMLTSSTAELKSIFSVANYIRKSPYDLSQVIERLNS